MIATFDVPDHEGEGGADTREGKGHESNERSIPDPSGVGLDLPGVSVRTGEGDAVEELADFSSGEDSRLATPDLQAGAFHGCRGVVGEIAAGDHPVEEAS